MHDTSSFEELAALAVQKPDVNAEPYALAGRVVTMAADDPNASGVVIDDGVLFIRGGEIIDVRRGSDGVAPGFEGVPIIQTQATLYPGLIDLHNHLGYNVCPLWTVPKLYKNRDEWNDDPDYAANVKGPVGLLANNKVLAPKVVRYVEAKALVNGTSTGQGMKLAYKKGGIVKYFPGAMRNVEATGNKRLHGAQTKIADLDPRKPDDIEKFGHNLANFHTFLCHLSEGRDEAARQHFLDLAPLSFVQPSLVGIHALALTKSDYTQLAAAGAKIVWSPFSNMLLYGSTLNLRDVLAAEGLSVALGCDWSPSGSKGLLEELKVARYAADTQYLQDTVTDEQLVRMVTTTPASILGWGDDVGSLQPNRIADVLAVGGTDGDPYTQLVKAREHDVRLLIIDGVARYGDRDLVSSVLATDPAVDVSGLDEVAIGKGAKVFYLNASSSPINDLTVSAAQAELLDAVTHLDDLPDPATQPGLAPMSVDDGFTLVLDDMESSGSDIGIGQGIRPEFIVEPATSIRLDSLVVDDDHLKDVAGQNNIPQGLTRFLCSCYGVDFASLG